MRLPKWLRQTGARRDGQTLHVQIAGDSSALVKALANCISRELGSTVARRPSQNPKGDS